MRRDGRLLSPSVVEDTDWRIVGVADFNGDGHSDFLWQHQSSGLFSVWHMNGLGRSDGVLLLPGELGFQIRIVTLRAIGDVNGDEWPDLVWHIRQPVSFRPGSCATVNAWPRCCCHQTASPTPTGGLSVPDTATPETGSSRSRRHSYVAAVGTYRESARLSRIRFRSLGRVLSL